MNSVVRVAVIEDLPVAVAGLRAIFKMYNAPIEIVGDAPDCNGALALIEETKPELALIDIRLKNGDCGFQLTQELLHRYKDLKVIIHSQHSDRFNAERTFEIGAHGFIAKAESGSVYLEAVKTVMNGDSYVSRTVFTDFLKTQTTFNARPFAALRELSEQERRVFEYTGKRLGPGEIAEQMHVCAGTVSQHKHRARQKLGFTQMKEFNRFAEQWVERQN